MREGRSVREVDVAILGAGTAGLNARRAARAEGASALLLDPGPLGTTCAREGCMPSKLLLAAAETAWRARHASTFGVEAGPIRVDAEAVFERVRKYRDGFVGSILETMEEHRQKGELLDGRARFLAPGRLRVEREDGEDLEVRARSVVVATGSRPFVPPPFRGLDGVLMHTGDLFELRRLPRSVLVCGTGAVGLELGQALHRLGVRVTLVGIDGTIGPLTDPGVGAAAADVLGAELDLHPRYHLVEARRVPEGVRVRFVEQAADTEVRERAPQDPDPKNPQDPRVREHTYERVLVAAGRQPALADLDWEAAGVTLGERGIPPFDPQTFQVPGHPVFLAGDVLDERAVLHEAAHEGRGAGRNAGLVAAGRSPRPQGRMAELAIVFSDPQLAVVGPSYRVLRATHGTELRVGQVDFTRQGRARVMDEARGRVHIYGHRSTGELLGAELAAPRAEHMAHLLAWAVQSRFDVERALSMPFYHPVLEEGLQTALRDLGAGLG